MAAYASATPPASPAEASSNHAAMVTKLADDEWLEAICAEGYSTVIDGRMSFKLSVDAVSRMLLRSLAHVGLERDRPHTWDARTHSEYPTIDVLFQHSDADEKVTAQVKLYAMSLFVACRSQGANPEMQSKFENVQDAYMALAEFESESSLDALRSKVGAMWREKQGSSGAGGVGVTSSSPMGGSTLTVTSHTAKLPKLPKSFTSDGAKFRQLLSWISEDEKNQTYTAVSDALVDQSALLETWNLWQAEKGGGMPLSEWDALKTEASVVQAFVHQQTKKLNASAFHAQDLKACIEYVQNTDTSTADYLEKKHRLMSAAALSGKVVGTVPEAVRGEEGRCKTATDGLLRGIRKAVRNHVSSKWIEQTAAGTTVEGYSPNDFTKWELFRSYSVSFAYNLEIDGGGKPAAVDGGGTARAHDKSGLSHKTHRRLNESRSHYVATAVSAGYDYNGCGMFADEYVFAAEGHAKAAPCLTYEQVKALPFPPLLVNADGKRVADGQQICKHSWKGKDCPLKSCNYRHVSKDDFVGELESGKASAIPAQMHKQQQQQSGNSSYSASGSGASTLDEQRLKLLEDNLTKQSELLLQVSTKLDTIQSSSAGADSQALKARREAAEKKRAQLAMQQATLAAELDEIDKAAQDGGAFISVTPQSEEFWVGSVLNSAAKMLGRFDREGCYLADRGGGLPLCSLTLGVIEIVCMMDTGCSPSALISEKALTQVIHQLGRTLKLNFKKFQQPKTISGVGEDAVKVIGTVDLPLLWNGRPLPICAGVMANGATGCCDLLVGNYHMRHDWNFQMDADMFTVRKPPDNMLPFSIPLDWRLSRGTESALWHKWHGVHVATSGEHERKDGGAPSLHHE